MIGRDERDRFISERKPKSKIFPRRRLMPSVRRKALLRRQRPAHKLPEGPGSRSVHQEYAGMPRSRFHPAAVVASLIRAGRVFHRVAFDHVGDVGVLAVQPMEAMILSSSIPLFRRKEALSSSS